MRPDPVRLPSFRRSLAASAALAVTTAAVLLSTAPTAGARTADPAVQAGRYHHTWASDVNVRVSAADPNACGRHPSVADCSGTSGTKGGAAPVAAKSARPYGPYSVTAYETVNIRSKPNTSARAFDQIQAGETRTDALCWTHGETVRDHGYTNDVWIGFTEGWASAVYLKGNEYAGLPVGAKC
ncbi:SH3 domain-containing protein [Streptomyces andamanensis]|uniref:SH3 domain-containing protein n=1 Tax=Streptomyces andamanensis TaxID=1565035 RepID=A0ABV8T7L7_9ACTN